jgi:hypothetical protein
MYSRFQTLVSGLKILKKSYVAADHVKKILRSLPAKWKPKVTGIEEARDLNTPSLKDLISSLKCHEIGLNEEEPMKKSKSIALKSKGKSSKALKSDESEDESSSGGFEEDPEAGEMAMLSKRLQYLLVLAKGYQTLPSTLLHSSMYSKEGEKYVFRGGDLEELAD